MTTNEIILILAYLIYVMHLHGANRRDLRQLNHDIVDLMEENTELTLALNKEKEARDYFEHEFNKLSPKMSRDEIIKAFK